MNNLLSNVKELFFTSGAVAAYAALAWQFWNARTRVRIRAELFENPWGIGIRFNVNNRGTKSTTLTELIVEYKDHDENPITHNLHVNPEIGGLDLPLKLMPGDAWKGAVFYDRVNEAETEDAELRRDRFKWLEMPSVIGAACKFQFSHRDRPYKRRVKPERGHSPRP